MINELTEAQVQSMPEYVDKWIKIGLDTTEIDLNACIEAVKALYLQQNKAVPKLFILANGPKEAMRFINFADKVELTESQMMEMTPQELSDSVRSSIDKVVPKNKVSSFVSPSFYGSHDAGHLAFYDFFSEHFSIETEKISNFKQISINSGWGWMFSDLVIFSKKPTKISMNANGKLHNEKEPSIEYQDGTKVYSFNGINVPEKWVLERETMDPSEIFECSDVDVRAAGIALFGYSRLKNRLDYKIHDGEPTTDIGALISIKIPGLSTRGRFLEAICPRNGPVFLGVPLINPWDNNKDIETAVGAQAFLARLPESAYCHPPIRT